MITQASRKALLLSFISLSILSGCSSSHANKSGTPIQDVYYSGAENAGGGTNRSNSVLWRPSTSHERSEVDVYTLHNSPRVPVSKLPNPTIYFYIPPKISKTDRVPVPGYFSEFKMYERDEYALPGERNLSNTEYYEWNE